MHSSKESINIENFATAYSKQQNEYDKGIGKRP